MPPAAVTRRAALRAGLALPLLLALPACSSSEPEAPDPDVALAAAAQAREDALLALYDAAIVAHPDLAATVAPLRAEHVAHAAALRAARPSAGASAPPAPTVVSADQATAVRELVTAETRAVAELGAQVAGAGAALASLLVSILGSEASHAAALSGGLALPTAAP